MKESLYVSVNPQFIVGKAPYNLVGATRGLPLMIDLRLQVVWTDFFSWIGTCDLLAGSRFGSPLDRLQRRRIKDEDGLSV